jgi:uncharacterized protein
MDLMIVAAVFAATLLIANVLGSAYAGTYAVLVSLAACTWRLAAAHSSWLELGLRVPKSWLRTSLWSLALLVVTALVSLAIINPVARAAHWAPLDLSRFAGLHGNGHALLAWLLLAWTSAAIAEELVFRGFLISHLQQLWRATPAGRTLAVLMQAVCFGAAHYYLGPRGVVSAMVMGVVYGAMYVATDRNLPALVLAHGATDSLSLMAIYTGAAIH